MDDRLKVLVDAGLTINLNGRSLEKINSLSEQEVKALAKLCKKLTEPGASLTYSHWPLDQPPTHTPS